MDWTRLSLPAARLLILLVYEVGPGNTLLTTAGELGERIGLRKRHSIYKAWGELEAAGLIRTRGANGRTGLTLLSASAMSNNEWYGNGNGGLGRDENDIYHSTIRATTVAAGEQSSLDQADSSVEGGGRERGQGEGGRVEGQGVAAYMASGRDGGQGVAVTVASGRDDGTSSDDILLDRCLEVDALPSDGPTNQRTSPFQVRRRKQIELVQDIFAREFPGQPRLTRDNATEMLRLCDERAEDVHDAVVGLSQWNPTAPLTYTLAALRKRRARMTLPSAAAPMTAGSSALSPDLPDASPEWLRAQDEGVELLRRAGYEWD